jgi:hypothetical protein
VTEPEWEACTEPDDLLEFLRDRGTDRQFRLFICACCRRFLPLMPAKSEHDRRLCERLVVAGERYADRSITMEQMAASVHEMDLVKVSHEGYLAAVAAQQAISREIAGCPRPMLRGRNQIAHPASAGSEYARTVASRLLAKSKTAKGSTPAARRRIATVAEKQYQVAVLRDVFGDPFRPVPAGSAQRRWRKQWETFLTWSNATIPQLARAVYDERRFDRLPVLADALEEAGCSDAAILSHCREPAPHVRGCWVVDAILGPA